MWVNTHFNHPSELTPEAFEACTRLADAGHADGQPVGAPGRRQRRPADRWRRSAAASCRMRVRPYYLFQCDLVRGVEHFRTPLSRGHRDHGVPARAPGRHGDTARSSWTRRTAAARSRSCPTTSSRRARRTRCCATSKGCSWRTPSRRAGGCRFATGRGRRIGPGQRQGDGDPAGQERAPGAPPRQVRPLRGSVGAVMIRIRRIYSSALASDRDRSSRSRGSSGSTSAAWPTTPRRSPRSSTTPARRATARYCSWPRGRCGA